MTDSPGAIFMCTSLRRVILGVVIVLSGVFAAAGSTRDEKRTDGPALRPAGWFTTAL